MPILASLIQFHNSEVATFPIVTAFFKTGCCVVWVGCAAQGGLEGKAAALLSSPHP